MDVQTILQYRNCPDQLAQSLTGEEIAILTTHLADKDDELRYVCFLTLQSRSQEHDDIYPYFDLFAEKLISENSYQRNIGLVLIAENIKWDKQNKFDKIYNEYTKHFSDKKFITSRQAIQNIAKWLVYKRHLINDVADKLMSIDLSVYKNTQSPLLLADIFESLIEIYKINPSATIKDYLYSNLNNGTLSKANMSKFKKIVSSL